MPQIPRHSARTALVGLGLLLPLLGCAGTTGIRPLGLPAESMPIDLERFMGDWYVIAHIPLPQEAQAHEAIESYRLEDDGRIDVRFQFCDGSLDGPREVFTFAGWVVDPETNAEWRVRPVWPLRFRYQITELAPDYTRTVVESGSNAWIMARTPQLDETVLQATIDRLSARGFDVTALRRVPHDDGRCGDDA